ncbi:MAG TPA: hypothetical protein VIW24_04895 [Aldersonia sp.]
MKEFATDRKEIAADPREDEVSDEVLDAVHGGYAPYGEGSCTRARSADVRMAN